MTDDARHCPDDEEVWNAISHGVGAALAAVALLAMVWQAIGTWDAWRLVGAVAHGGSLTMLLASSAAYHGLPRGWWKNALQVVDHVGIFLLIAGSYTPFMLLTVQGWTGFTILTLQWVLAAIGIVLKLWFGPMRLRALGLAMYIGMGWMGVFAAFPLFEALPGEALGLLVGGGLMYMVGVIFYLWDSLPFNHFLWHLFVLAGAGSHVAVTWGWVIPS